MFESNFCNTRSCRKCSISIEIRVLDRMAAKDARIAELEKERDVLKAENERLRSENEKLKDAVIAWKKNYNSVCLDRVRDQIFEPRESEKYAEIRKMSADDRKEIFDSAMQRSKERDGNGY